MFQKVIASILAFLCSLGGLIFPSDNKGDSMTQSYKQSYIAGEVAYLNSLSQENGALPMTAPHYDYTVAARTLPTVNGVSGETYGKWNTAVVNPYFSAISVLGMIEAAPDETKSSAEGFINWYFDNLNTAQTDICGIDGTIYDYRIFVNPNDSSDIIEITARDFYAADFSDQNDNTYCYDSTDSYAATFMSVLASYTKAYGDMTVITSHADEIDRILNAMLSTYVSSLKLTAAKPNYAVCYLMDNCEVYAGLKDAQYLYGLLGNSSKASICSSKADSIQSGIKSKLYNIFTANYYAAVSTSGTKMSAASSSAIKNFYPEGAAQLYPVIYGVISPSSINAKLSYKRFCNNLGNDWINLTADSFPWTIVARAASKMGDYDRLKTYADSVKSSYIDQGHKYPYYNAEAGSMLVALSY